MIGKRVQGQIWGYVPSLDGEDVDKDYDGDVIGVVVGALPQNPHVLRVKVEQYKPNIRDIPWTTDLSAIGNRFIGSCNYKEGYLEEWYYNLKVI